MLDYRQIHVKAISPVLEEYPQIRLGYVFGSFLCRERFRDVDIAVLLDPDYSLDSLNKDVLGCSIGEALHLGCDVDLRIMNNAPIEFRYKIVRSGSLFFARSERERINYEIRVVDEFLDYRETLSWFDTQGGASW